MPYKSVLTCYDSPPAFNEGRLPIGVVMEEPNGAGVEWRFTREATRPTRDRRFTSTRIIRQKIEGLGRLWANLPMYARYGPPPDDPAILAAMRVPGWPLWRLPSPREWMASESRNEYSRNTIGFVEAGQDFTEFYHLAVAGRASEATADLPRDTFLAEHPSPPLLITLWRPGLRLWWPGIEADVEQSQPGTREHFEASVNMLMSGVVGYSLVPNRPRERPRPIRASRILQDGFDRDDRDDDARSASIAALRSRLRE